MIEGVKRVTGFVDESGPMVRVQLESGSTFIGPMLPVMAALLRKDYFEPVAQKKAHRCQVCR